MNCTNSFHSSKGLLVFYLEILQSTSYTTETVIPRNNTFPKSSLFFVFFHHLPEVSFWHPRWLSGKVSACNAGDLGSIPGSGRSLGEGNGNPLQYSCLENPMNREAWWVTVHGTAKSKAQLGD